MFKWCKHALTELKQLRVFSVMSVLGSLEVAYLETFCRGRAFLPMKGDGNCIAMVWSSEFFSFRTRFGVVGIITSELSPCVVISSSKTDSDEDTDFVIFKSLSFTRSGELSVTLNFCDKMLQMPLFSLSKMLFSSSSMLWWVEELLRNIETAVASLKSSAICSPLSGLIGLKFSSSCRSLLTVTHLSLWPIGPKNTSSSSSKSLLVSLEIIITILLILLLHFFVIHSELWMYVLVIYYG